MGGNGLCWRRKGEKEAPSSMKLFIRISNPYIRRRRRTILQYISSSLHVALLTIPTTGHYSSSSSSAYQSNRQCKSCLSTPLFHSSFSMCRPYRSVFVAEKSIHRDHTWHMSYVLHVFCYSVSLPFPSSSVLELNLRKCKCITICCLSLCLVSPKIPSGLHPPTHCTGHYHDRGRELFHAHRTCSNIYLAVHVFCIAMWYRINENNQPEKCNQQSGPREGCTHLILPLNPHKSPIALLIAGWGALIDCRNAFESRKKKPNHCYK